MSSAAGGKRRALQRFPHPKQKPLKPANKLDLGHAANWHTRPTPRALKHTYRSKTRAFWRRHRRLKWGLALTGCVALMTASLLATRLFLTANKIFIQDGKAAALDENVDPSQLKTEGDGRINVLLIGVGGAGHEGGDLSDTIMIVSVDPVAHLATMFSVPRDLYVQIDGFGSAKINAAHVYGNQYNYPGGGPKLLADTLTQYLGVPIHYFVRGDFTAFKDAVNQVGGVDIDVKKGIVDPTFPTDSGGFTTYRISKGNHHLNGQEALDFVRSRHTTSDFDRADRQQQLLVAIKDKALSFATLLNPLKINNLLKTAGDHVRTDIGLNEGKRLLDIAGAIPAASITRGGLTDDPTNYLVPANINGQSVLAPTSGEWDDVRRFVRSLMIDSYLRSEHPTVRVLNGTNRPGLADETAKLLLSLGYNVIATGNADTHTHQVTQVLAAEPAAKPYTANYLQRRFKTTVVASGEHPGADFTIILGSDYTPNE